MKRKTKSNKALLVERLFTSYVDRVKPFKASKKEASHLQSMAQHFGEELLALAMGASECRRHHDRVAGACPICRGLWPAPTIESTSHDVRPEGGGSPAGNRRRGSQKQKPHPAGEQPAGGCA